MIEGYFKAPLTFNCYIPSRERFSDSPETRGSIIGFPGLRIGFFQAGFGSRE